VNHFFAPNRTTPRNKPLQLKSRSHTMNHSHDKQAAEHNQDNDNNAMPAFKRVLQGLGNVLFGVADTTPAEQRTSAGGGKIAVEVLPPKTPKGAQMANALGDAIAQFQYDEVNPHRSFSPEDVYRVRQLCIIETPDNLHLVAEITRLRRDQRSRMVKAKFKEFDGFDLGEFSDVRIEQATTNAQDPVFIVAGDGPQRVKIAFEFHGEFVEATSIVAPATAGKTEVNNAAERARASTLAPDNVAARARATTLTPHSPAEQLAPLLVLHITEPGLAERSVSLQRLPVRIGRSQDCDITLDNAYVSRVQLTVSQQASGGMQISDHTQTGTLFTAPGQVATALERDRLTRLPDGATLTLAHSLPAHAVSIRVQIPATVAAHVAAPRAAPKHDAATLAPPAAEHPALFTSTPFTPTLAQPRTAQPTLVVRATPTLYVDSKKPAATAAPVPLARLRLRYFDGQTELIDITELPFDIGREPAGSRSACIADAVAKVSRQHLRIHRQEAGAFLFENHAAATNGTWIAGEKLTERFSLKPVAANSKDGWVLLGERALSANSVALRLEHV
jgi:pSer/pThr/pTyr-binding forkhead associated (FHA) protein